MIVPSSQEPRESSFGTDLGRARPGVRRPRLLYDARDFELADLVNEFRTVGKRKKPEYLRRLFNPALHPRGIKELAATQERRIAYAVIRLLESFDQGSAQDRIIALRALHDEVFFGPATSLQINSARVFLTIMKELVREANDYQRQVDLAHDFFAAVTGRPREIRRQLRKYHLLEMSEAWNQVAFDHHVHDAHTKGRKSPTHLVLDAWIKGIRELVVVYYYYWTAEGLTELIDAASIMGVSVRFGLEVAARCHDKYAQFIWVPVGLASGQDLQAFIGLPAVKAFMDKGREVAKLQETYVLSLLDRFNDKHRLALNQEYGLAVQPLKREEFLGFVGVGQPSLTHLAEFIHHQCLEQMRQVCRDLREKNKNADAEEIRAIRDRVAKMDHLLPSVIAENWLQRSMNPDLPHPSEPRDGEGVPELLRLTSAQLFDQLKLLRAGCDIVLNLTNLTPADVIEILYQGRGAITHLEIFNLKDYRLKKTTHVREVAQIRQIFNGGNPILVKRLLRDTLKELEQSSVAYKEDRIRALRAAMENILDFSSFYSRIPIRTHIGSDSVGRTESLFGMGLAVADTLPWNARREFRAHPGTREMLPLRTGTELHAVWRRRESPLKLLNLVYRMLRKVPGLREFGHERKETYEVIPNTTHFDDRRRGNILTLGGIEEHPANGFKIEEEIKSPPGVSFRRLNTPLRNLTKVFVGFVPAFLTFYLTKDWWVLAWLGAPIWFGITGLRNVLQSIVGGGGLARSQLLTWRDLVSWERVTDSMLYTGFSVPLLDWLVKSELLQRGFGVTTATSPLLLYSVMALANGIYLFSHNTFRGLPRAAALGNFFRSVLAIPIAFLLNMGCRWLLVSSGMAGPEADAELQKWAAIITKAASDLVAGFIEGTADRNVNVRTRLRDYRAKLGWLLANHGRLEAHYPDQDVLQMLESPKEFIKTMEEKEHDLEVRQIVNSLDLMYFWMRQPRAHPVFRSLLSTLTAEERQIILRTQRLLERQRLISHMMLDGLVGRNFAAALSFYLDKSPAYLRDMRALLVESG